MKNNRRPSGNPPIIELNGGILNVWDSEPLSAEPDNSWTEEIAIEVVINVKPGSPGTYQVTVSGSSNTSDTVSNISFDVPTRTLNIDLNDTSRKGKSYFGTSEPYEFSPPPAHEDVEISVNKSGQKAGRTKHKLTYAGITE